ncbi:hypothetical protein B566_EDAN012057 [Ephemera danica]|nr:hypothetical protein B566_EDAN012057 [Ephemera danica]
MLYVCRWTIQEFIKGYSRDLEADDLYEPLKDHKSDRLGNILEKNWNRELKSPNGGKKPQPSFMKAMIKSFGPRFMCFGFVLLFVELVVKVAQPIFLGRLIRYFTPSSGISKQEAYMFALGALKLSHSAMGLTTAGQVVNLLSNDVNRFDVVPIFMHYLWVGPIETVICSYLMWSEMGMSALFGIAMLLLTIPLQGYLGKKTSSIRMKTAVRTDERVRLMNEIISGIQVIKMYTWEKPFAKLVSLARRNEIRQIKLSSYIRGVYLSFIMFTTRSFLLLDEVSGSSHSYSNGGKPKEVEVCLQGAKAQWNFEMADATLVGINLKVTSGQLVALSLSSGTIHVSGSLSYAAQEPWLFAGSLRQNITFGQNWNAARYREVIRVCALETDLAQLPYGDRTIVGERGVSLSGGQRARVSLARAVYKEADIYLLDDPLSAVDAHVGRHLFDDCIKGFLKHKAVVLVTHQLQLTH